MNPQEETKIKYTFSDDFKDKAVRYLCNKCYGTTFKEANYYNISNLLQEDYDTIGYIQDRWSFDKDQKIRNFINENKLKFGDFLFCGSCNPLRKMKH